MGNRTPASKKFYEFVMSLPNYNIMDEDTMIHNNDGVFAYRPCNVAVHLGVERTNNVSQYMKRYSEVYPNIFRIEGTTSDRLWFINHDLAIKNKIQKPSVIMSKHFDIETMKLNTPPKKPQKKNNPKPMYLCSHKFQFWGVLDDLEFITNTKLPNFKKAVTLKAGLVRDILLKRMKLPLNYSPIAEDKIKYEGKSVYKDLRSKKETVLFSITMPFWFYWKLQKFSDSRSMSVAEVVRNSIKRYKNELEREKTKNENQTE